MKKRVWGVICILLGLAVAVPGALSAVNSMNRLPPLNDNHVGGTGIVAQVRYYGLRWEVLLVALGGVLLLTAAVLFLMPRSRRVPVDVTQNDASAPLPGQEEAAKTVPQTSASPTVECYLRTQLMGTAFINADGSSRQSILKDTAAGDVVVCRTISHRYEPDAIGVFTVNGRQLGYLDAAFIRTVRDRYPNRQIGVCVERINGGNGLPYTCDVRVAVFRG